MIIFGLNVKVLYEPLVYVKDFQVDFDFDLILQLSSCAPLTKILLVNLISLSFPRKNKKPTYRKRRTPRESRVRVRNPSVGCHNWEPLGLVSKTAVAANGMFLYPDAQWEWYIYLHLASFIR